MSNFDSEPEPEPEQGPDHEPGTRLDDAGSAPSLTLRPIGVVRSPFTERLQAPRQPRAVPGGEGRIELFIVNGLDHALEDLGSFRYIWVLFWFHKSHGFRPKVLPPRSDRRRGVFATRSPYRPNPIGLSAVELLRIAGNVLHVRDLDILDGTPVLDIKPYIAYTDALLEATNGWLDSATRPEDPLPDYAVEFAPRALEGLALIEGMLGIGEALRASVEGILRLGPQPHPYRRIRRERDGSYLLGHKDWRFAFQVLDGPGHRIVVTELRSGYKPSDLFRSDDPERETHRAFVARFGA